MRGGEALFSNHLARAGAKARDMLGDWQLDRTILSGLLLAGLADGAGLRRRPHRPERADAGRALAFGAGLVQLCWRHCRERVTSSPRDAPRADVRAGDFPRSGRRRTGWARPAAGAI